MKKLTGTKKWIRLSVILYIVIVSVAAVFTMAWFMFDETATIKTADNMQITAGAKLEIALVEDGGGELEWGQLISCDTPTTLPDISGDGFTFHFPKVLTEDDKTFEASDTFYEITDASKDKDSYFITLHLRFKTTLPMEVYLSEESFISGKSDILVGKEAGNKSVFGDLSRDGIAGAVRVAFIEYDPSAMDEYTLKNIWIPNDNYELSYSNEQIGNGDYEAELSVDGNREYEVLEDGTSKFKYGYMVEDGDKMVFEPWTIDQYVSHYVSLDSQDMAIYNSGGVQWINEAPSLLTFDQDDFNDGIAERDLIIKIWIEGTDREADKAFTDGQLKYNFSFVGIQKESFEEKNADLVAKNIVSDGQKLYYKNATGEEEEIVDSNLLQYSYNGVDWKPYSGNMEAEQNASYQYVYVRYAETVEVKASKPIYVEFST